MTATTRKDPIALFRDWLIDAEKSEPNDPNAMTLATATPEGAPSARMVLLSDVDERGFIFYTNLASRKATELNINSRAALCFHWKTLQRQVRVEGTVKPVDEAEADAYFASRPRMSRIGAWASRQSQPLADKYKLEKRIAEFTARFHVGPVPRPDFWSGFRLLPEHIEFWRERPFRLHDRVVYHRHEGGWMIEHLYP